MGNRLYVSYTVCACAFYLHRTILSFPFCVFVYVHAAHSHGAIFQLHSFALWLQHKTTTMSNSKISEAERADHHMFALWWPRYYYYYLFPLFFFPSSVLIYLLYVLHSTPSPLLTPYHSLPSLCLSCSSWSLPSPHLPPLLTETQQWK